MVHLPDPPEDDGAPAAVPTWAGPASLPRYIVVPGGIRPRKGDEKAYEAAMRRAVLAPYHRLIVNRVDRAAKDYRTIKAALDALRQTAIPPTLAPAQAKQIEQQLRSQAAAHKRRFRRRMRRFLGVRVDVIGDLAIEPLMERAISDNVGLIRTIPRRHHADLVKDLTKLADDDAFDQAKLRNLLRKRYKSTGYKLRRITRDQSNKLIGNLNNARQTQVGIDRYEWQTSEDERVRPSHVEKNGKIYAWDQPPPDTGHPGHDIQCRCVALAVIDRRVTGARGTPSVTRP